MSLEGCIKKVVLARGPKPDTFKRKNNTGGGSALPDTYVSGNYTITEAPGKDGFIVRSKDLSLDLTKAATRNKAEKVAVAHWKSQELDADDITYMQELMSQGRPDQEIVNRLEQNILKEQAEVVQLLESQGQTVKQLEATTLGESLTSRGEEAPTGAAKPGEVKVSSKVIDSTSQPVEPQRTTSQRSESSAKPSTKDDSGSFGFGSTTSNSDTSPQTGVSQDGEPLFLTRETAEEAMAILSEGSEIITRFLQAKTGGIQKIFLDTFTDSYLAPEDAVNITGRIPGKSKAGRRLDLNNKADLKLQRQIIEHEITHANTTAWLVKNFSETKDTKARNDINYFLRTVGALFNLPVEGLSKEAVNRITYIIAQESQIAQVSEFLAIMGAETDTAAEIFAALDRQAGYSEKTLKTRIKSLLNTIKDWIAGLSNKELANNINIDKLADALARTMDNGTEFREQRYEEARAYTQQEDLSFNYGPKAGEVLYRRKASFDYMNYTVASMLNSKLERKGKKIMGNLHNVMKDRFPIYTDVADKVIGIYDGSPALQQFVHAVTGERVNKVKKADVLSKFAEVNAQRTEIINDQVSRLNVLSRNLSESEKSDLDVFISQLPLHDYFLANEAGDLSTAESIEAEAKLLRKQLWKINMRAVRDAEQLIDWNIGIRNDKTGKLEQTLTGDIYNLDTKNYPQRNQGDFGPMLRRYLALESINRYGAKKLENLMKNEDLMNVVKDNSVANVIAGLDIQGTENVRDSLIQDYYKEPFQIKAVQRKDFRMYEFGEETGWKILKAPTKTELGIVYKPIIDSTDLAGAYTDMKLSSTDVNVGDDLRRFPGVVETKNGHKLLLTKAQKKELGLIEDFAQGLVRSAAHSIAAQESEIIRNAVLQDDTWMEVGTGRSEENLVDTIKADNIDNPWFIKLSEGTEYNKLDKDIRAKYMPVGGRASNVKGFNEKVDLVRKDISHWLLGGTASSLFQNPQMKWATRILKNLVSGAKIGMIVLNPVKIANDNLSNLTYLGVLGLDPLFIAKNYAEIQKDFAEYSELQRQVFQLKLQLVSRPESPVLQKKLTSLQKRLKANSIGDIGDKGFINSLGSDLVSRSADTLSGFQADMHKSLEYLLTDKAGNKNVVSHFIVQLQKIGYQAEDFFGYLGDIASRSKSTALLEQELDQVANRLREIKSEDDIVNYVAQFTTSPSSEAVRFGSAMTDLTDVLAKETLYRHFITQKLSPEDARIKVLDSFPDYKENMPLAIKQLSDVGILMFPSFWLRIQKIIYRMARDKPVGLATELMAQEMLGTDVNTIFEANLINKSNTFGGLVHPPFEPVGFGSVIPQHFF